MTHVPNATDVPAVGDDAARTQPTFDVSAIPFSYRGSWLNLSPIVGLHQHSDEVHLVSHRTDMTAVVALVPSENGHPVAAHRTATPAVLAWDTETGRVEAVFASTTSLRLRGRGIGLTLRAANPTLTPFTGTYLFCDPVDRAWTFTSYETGRRYRVSVLAGGASAVGAEALGTAVRQVAVEPGENGAWEIAFEEFETARRPFVPVETFAATVERVAGEFVEYLDAVAPWRGADTPASALAAYVLWSATVEPAGFVGREAVLMSKHWMDSVWSWDHCFNALALANVPDLALDQFLLPFDHQDVSGALPDSVTHSRVLYNFVKPPVHGWAFAALRRRLQRDVERATLELIYERLVRWSTFWLEFRVGTGRRLPCYHHGNDSGWDNSTVFDADRVVETADLAAFLALQLDVLGALALELGRAAEAAQWTSRAERLAADMLAQLWDGERFVAEAPLSGRRSTSDSLLTTLPIIASHRLPEGVAQKLAAQVARLLSDHGPGTEPSESVHYESDGYWRGPIWAPSTLLVEDGLRRGGFTDLADEISARFRRLCESSGFAENFDALNGDGLRDRAYTWTAAVYLVLASDYHGRRSPNAVPAD